MTPVCSIGTASSRSTNESVALPPGRIAVPPGHAVGLGVGEGTPVTVAGGIGLLSTLDGPQAAVESTSRAQTMPFDRMTAHTVASSHRFRPAFGHMFQST